MKKIRPNTDIKLFILSIWIMFLELFLIRWVSTEIRIFAYVNNLVLLACFLGMGLGCYFSSKKGNILYSFFVLAILILAARSTPFIKITDLLSGFSDSHIWYKSFEADNILSAIKGIILTVFMFGMMGAIFFPLGQLLGRIFNEHKNIIAAYSINISGCIVGMWLFGALSFMCTPPTFWFIITALFGVIFLEKKSRDIFIFAALVSFSLIVIATFETGLFTLWSPYQKLDVYENCLGNIPHGYNVKVNNVGYMGLLDISEKYVDRYFSWVKNSRRLNQYEIPYLFTKDKDNVLIVGSGGGNDASGALRQQVKSIDAVEIDRGIYRIGLNLHPEQPYRDRRVHLFIDDARSFFKKANKKYDVISFGLLDSHMLSSNYNNLRLDNYVYTHESFNEARMLLKPDGVMTVIFETGDEWIIGRLYRLLKEVFKSEPIVFKIKFPYEVFGYGGIMYIASANPLVISDYLNKDKELKRFIELHRVPITEKDIKVTTDDWPYLYIKKPLIPRLHISIILSLLIVLFIGMKGLFKRASNLNIHFLFLGAAFMLLEFQNITKSSLLFGSTWLVNIYMISAIMVLILLANLFTYYFKIKDIKPFYFLLFLSLLAMYSIPLNKLNIPNYYIKATLIAILMNIPIFFAGIIFINSFKNFPNKNVALGSNLLGASLGGLLESSSFLFGVKSLIISALLLYILSYFYRRR